MYHCNPIKITASWAITVELDCYSNVESVCSGLEVWPPGGQDEDALRKAMEELLGITNFSVMNWLQGGAPKES